MQRERYYIYLMELKVVLGLLVLDGNTIKKETILILGTCSTVVTTELCLKPLHCYNLRGVFIPLQYISLCLACVYLASIFDLRLIFYTHCCFFLHNKCLRSQSLWSLCAVFFVDKRYVMQNNTFVTVQRWYKCVNVINAT